MVFLNKQLVEFKKKKNVKVRERTKSPEHTEEQLHKITKCDRTLRKRLNKKQNK